MVPLSNTYNRSVSLPLTIFQLGFGTVPNLKPDLSTIDDSGKAVDPVAQVEILRDLHTLLLATEIREGKLVCGNCGHEYKIKEGIANFLLPSHLGEIASNSTSAAADGCNGSVR